MSAALHSVADDRIGYLAKARTEGGFLPYRSISPLASLVAAPSWIARCFAVSTNDLPKIAAHVGEGRTIYPAKV